MMELFFMKDDFNYYESLMSDDFFFLKNIPDITNITQINNNNHVSNHNYNIVPDCAILTNNGLNLFPSYYIEKSKNSSDHELYYSGNIEYSDLPAIIVPIIDKIRGNVSMKAIIESLIYSNKDDSNYFSLILEALSNIGKNDYSIDDHFIQKLKHALYNYHDNNNYYTLHPFFIRLQKFFYFNHIIDYYLKTGNSVFLIDIFPTITSGSTYHYASEPYVNLIKEMSNNYHNLIFEKNQYSDILFDFLFYAKEKHACMISQYNEVNYYLNLLDDSYSGGKLSIVYIDAKKIIKAITCPKNSDGFYQNKIDPVLSKSLKDLFLASKSEGDNYLQHVELFHDSVFTYYSGIGAKYRDSFIRVLNIITRMIIDEDNRIKVKDNNYYIGLSVIFSYIIENTSSISNNQLKNLYSDVINNEVFDNMEPKSPYDNLRKYGEIKTIVDYYISENHNISLHMIEKVLYN